jgi:tRNA C32,U32 (ribose-2'-O)-methylase TrmJ
VYVLSKIAAGLNEELERDAVTNAPSNGPLRVSTIALVTARRFSFESAVADAVNATKLLEDPTVFDTLTVYVPEAPVPDTFAITVVPDTTPSPTRT